MTVQRPLSDEEQSQLSKGELSNDLFRFNLQQRSLVATGESVPHDSLNRSETVNLAEVSLHEDSQGSTEHHRHGASKDQPSDRHAELSEIADTLKDVVDRVRSLAEDDPHMAAYLLPALEDAIGGEYKNNRYNSGVLDYLENDDEDQDSEDPGGDYDEDSAPTPTAGNQPGPDNNWDASLEDEPDLRDYETEDAEARSKTVGNDWDED